MIKSCEVRDIFTSEAQTLVCPVNTQGAMGKGLALAFKNRFPGLELLYKHACLNYIFATKGLYCVDIDDDKKVLLFPTKHFWRNPSKLRWVDLSLKKLSEKAEEYGITSLAIPEVGCGEGGLMWEDVHPLIDDWLGEEFPIPVHICLSPV